MRTDIQSTAAEVLDRRQGDDTPSGERLLARLRREGFVVVHKDDIPCERFTDGPEALGWNRCRAWLIKHHGPRL